MLTQSEKDVLNLIRWLSTLSIVLCHFLQAYGHIWAWILNVGVQVFFFLSGFLYGNKRIYHIKSFYIGRIKKLYVPYLTWMVVAIFLIFLTEPDILSTHEVIMSLLMVRTLPGLNHLWFMPIIFICYLLLPLFDRYITKNTLITVVISSILITTLLYFHYSSNFIWIVIYYIGYMCGRFPLFNKFMGTSSILISCIFYIYIIVSADVDINLWRSQTYANDVLHCTTALGIFYIIFFSR